MLVGRLARLKCCKPGGNSFRLSEYRSLCSASSHRLEYPGQNYEGTYSTAKFCQARSRNYSSAQSARKRLTDSYCHVPSDVALVNHTVGQSLLNTVERFPDRECMVFCDTGVRMTFAQLWEESQRMAGGLVKLGFERGDRVGIWGPSSVEWVVTQFATSLVGIVLVNVNPAYQVDEVGYALRKVGCKSVVVAGKFKTQDYYRMLCELSPELETSSPGHLRCERAPDLTTVIMMGDEQRAGTFRYRDVVDMGTNEWVVKVERQSGKLHFDDAINIQFTSGTTGNPKGATLTHHNVVNNANLIGIRAGYHRDADRICVQVPLYHCFGMVAGTMCMAYHGVTNVFPAAGYEPEKTAECLAPERVTMIYGTPTMYIDTCAIVEKNNQQLPHLTKGVMAGSPCPVQVINKTEQVLAITLQVAYGSTETSPVTSMMKRDDDRVKRTTTVGSLLDHCEKMVVNEKGRVCAIGEPGELLTRGYFVMMKYWGDPEKTAKAIDSRGWYHSGDVGVMDADGYVQVTGRIKDLIIRGGENIYPAEVENFIHRHPQVDDVQVIGVPDKRLGEEIAAWIRLRPGESCTVDDIKQFCKGKLSHFKIPKHIKFVDSYPVTVTRKVQKYKMRELYSKELGLTDE